ncbi:MAG: hypothetical protein EAZ13_01920 [Sphingobacteriia bacterium]|nr:MAG: hypothetical protein EAZ13_01920 [Sphingobacteriia bacterium]
MFLFPLIYIGFFIAAIKQFAADKVGSIMLFLVFGLPIYTAALSVTYLYGFTQFIPYLQICKEIIIVLFLGYSILNIQTKFEWLWMDKFMLGFILYTVLYIFLPIGNYSIIQKSLAFKSICFFPFIYFTGRLFNFRKINLNKLFSYIGLLTIVSAVVLIYELITYTHLQTNTGYALLNEQYFGQSPSGNYGLSWTFEIENGLKRFASFFSNPLEFSAATLVATAALAALITNNKNQFIFTPFTQLIFASTCFSILFALSRASLASYGIMIYVYALVTNKKQIIQLIHALIIAAIALITLFVVQNDLVDFIVNTITFSNASSMGHVLEWINGIEAIGKHPLGMGLGESGRLSAFEGLNTGGENQFIIIGVQLGLIGLVLYLAAYMVTLKNAFQIIKSKTGKIRRLALFILLVKIGLFIPMFTAEIESYIYISYITWFLIGLLFNMLAQKNQTSN